jgi:hypothetical protein
MSWGETDLLKTKLALADCLKLSLSAMALFLLVISSGPNEPDIVQGRPVHIQIAPEHVSGMRIGY